MTVYVEGATQNAPDGKGHVSSIKVVADNKCWFYKIPSLATPIINIATDDANCKIEAEDQILSSKLSVVLGSQYEWKSSQYEAKGCTATKLTLKSLSFLFDAPECKNSDGSTDCKLEFDLQSVREWEIRINENPLKDCSTSTPTPTPTPVVTSK